MKKYLFLSLIFIGVLVLPSTILAADVVSMVNTLADVVYKIGVAVVVIGWVISGILFLTAAGAPDKLSIAKKALIASIAGTIIIIIGKEAANFIGTTFGIPAG